MFRFYPAAALLLSGAVAPSLLAAVPDVLDEVVVIAPADITVARDRVAGNIQFADADQIEKSQTLDLSDFLSRHFGSVNVNHAQNNPLQPDLNFRGFTASPLLGLPQGLTVYQNGVRMNEPFGDTVNWDLIPLSTIDSVQLLAGSNPVFGLNTLGGALTLQTKNGFNYVGSAIEVYGGSFGRRVASIQTGGNSQGIGYYVNADYFEEDGWRDYSASDAIRLFGALSARGDRASGDVSVTHAQSGLRGNGASPEQLLEIDRAAVFTHPDITENRLTQVVVAGSLALSDTMKMSGNAFYRLLDTDTFNGDGTIFEACVFPDGEFLVEDGFIDSNDDDACNFTDDEAIEPVLDQHGNRIDAEIAGQPQDAVNNIGRRTQEGYGASGQLSGKYDFGARHNTLLFGFSINRGGTSFASQTEVAQLLANRATSRTGIFADEFRTSIDSRVSTASLYFSDSLDISPFITATYSGRYDRTRVELQDRSGQTPKLNGNHSFSRFNPALSATFRVAPTMLLYATLSESARAPTAVELACASEDAPCSLPNAFLADPPLEQVVATSAELGARGEFGKMRWHLGAFHTINEHDILFQTTGGAQANVGFFANVGDTRRLGVELELSHPVGRAEWYLQYTYVKAIFEDEFIINSPNHPALEQGTSDAIVGDGKLRVSRGSVIPGIPAHQANLGADYSMGKRWSIGGDVSFRSGVYLRGDEINELEATEPFTVVNLRGEFRINDKFKLFARIENVFDAQYETFGLLGEPDEVFPQFSESGFFGAGPPRGAWLGIRAHW